MGATVTAWSQENQPNPRAGDAAERVVRESRGATREGEHRTELGMYQRQHQDADAADDPRDEDRGAGVVEPLLRAEEPAGPDDGAHRGPEETDQPDLAGELDVGLAVRPVTRSW